jgi:hypothetical protein
VGPIRYRPNKAVAGWQVLPDFPVLKKRLADAMGSRLRRRTDAAPLPGRVQRLYEGDGMLLVRADGSRDDSDFRRLEEKLSIGLDEIGTMTMADLEAKVDAMGESIARQKAAATIEELDRAVAAVGNVFDARGKKLTAEAVLDMIESMWLDCDDGGELNMPSLWMHPVHHEDAVRELERLEREPALRERFEALKEKKREEWRDREARRVLVG